MMMSTARCRRPASYDTRPVRLSRQITYPIVQHGRCVLAAFQLPLCRQWQCRVATTSGRERRRKWICREVSTCTIQYDVLARLDTGEREREREIEQAADCVRGSSKLGRRVSVTYVIDVDVTSRSSYSTTLTI